MFACNTADIEGWMLPQCGVGTSIRPSLGNLGILHSLQTSALPAGLVSVFKVFFRGQSIVCHIVNLIKLFSLHEGTFPSFHPERQEFSSRILFNKITNPFPADHLPSITAFSKVDFQVLDVP
jgi:hypothetical protein